jgi:hypothetical protein
MSGTEFDPGATGTGADKIVSLVLPDAAESTKAATSSAPLFKNFTALTSVSGENITTLGTYAFYTLTSLTEASFPNVVTIGEAVFRDTYLAEANFPKAESLGANAFGQTLLIKVSLPNAVTFGNAVFIDCTVLETVDLPSMEVLPSSYTFKRCTALHTVNLPKLKNVGSQTFAETGGTALTITMGATAPTVKTAQKPFTGVKVNKTVTVRVPEGATGYDSTWQTNFKKDSTKITLTIVEIDEE